MTAYLPRVPYATCADKFVLLCLSASVMILFESFGLFKYRFFARVGYFVKFYFEGHGRTWYTNARSAVMFDWTHSRK